MIRHGECLPYEWPHGPRTPSVSSGRFFYGNLIITERLRADETVARIWPRSTHVPRHPIGEPPARVDTCTRYVPLRRVETTHTTPDTPISRLRRHRARGREGQRRGRSGTTGCRREKRENYEGEYLTVVAMLPESGPSDERGKLAGKPTFREPRSRWNTPRVRSAIGDRDRRIACRGRPSLGRPTGSSDPLTAACVPPTTTSVSADSRLAPFVPVRLPTQIACY